MLILSDSESSFLSKLTLVLKVVNVTNCVLEELKHFLRLQHTTICNCRGDSMVLHVPNPFQIRQIWRALCTFYSK